jgi:hypothetical protein
MKRAIAIIGLVALVAAPAAAQWLGMPSWNSPNGSNGVGISVDYGQPGPVAGNGTAYGGRVSLSTGTAMVTAGASSWKPETFTARLMSWGGTVAARLIGGHLIPVALNLQLGGSYHAKLTSGTQTLPEATTALAAVGLSAPLSVSLIRIEPYVSPSVRYHRYWNVPAGVRKEDTNLGWVLGGNADFGPIGIHVAYDSEKFADGSIHGVFGVGANLQTKFPRAW